MEVKALISSSKAASTRPNCSAKPKIIERPKAGEPERQDHSTLTLDNVFNRYQPEQGAEVGSPAHFAGDGIPHEGSVHRALPAALRAAMLLGCSLSPRPMLPRSALSSISRESCRLLSSCAAGSRGSPTTRRRGRARGALPGGRRCQPSLAR
jgi:hypothetical protein